MNTDHTSGKFLSDRLPALAFDQTDHIGTLPFPIFLFQWEIKSACLLRLRYACTHCLWLTIQSTGFNHRFYHFFAVMGYGGPSHQSRLTREGFKQETTNISFDFRNNFLSIFCHQKATRSTQPLDRRCYASTVPIHMLTIGCTKIFTLMWLLKPSLPSVACWNLFWTIASLALASALALEAVQFGSSLLTLLNDFIGYWNHFLFYWFHCLKITFLHKVLQYYRYCFT